MSARIGMTISHPATRRSPLKNSSLIAPTVAST